MWKVVSDIEGMGRFSPENTGGTWTSGTPGTVGAKFKGTNKHGLIRWSTHCTVVDVVDCRRFSFESDEPKARWTLCSSLRERAPCLPRLVRSMRRQRFTCA
ncbi:SRPBCC family protein [Rhodococcus sp. 3Y1]